MSFLGRQARKPKLAWQAVIISVVAAIIGAVPCTVSAQNGTTQRRTDTTGYSVVEGRVIDSSDAHVAHAAVELTGPSARATETDTSGIFRFPSVSPGVYSLKVRRLGYAPSAQVVIVGAGQRARADVELVRTPQELAAIRVEERARLTAVTDPTGFRQRREYHSGGVFMTEDDISHRSPQRTEQLFRGIPSVNVDTGGIIVINRGETSFRDYYLPKKALNGFNSCIGAAVFVDGVEMPQPFNINQVGARSLRGIEIYRGPATTPLELQSPKSVCGTIALWTK